MEEDKKESLLAWISIKLAILSGSCYFCNFILSPVRDSVMERTYMIYTYCALASLDVMHCNVVREEILES